MRFPCLSVTVNTTFTSLVRVTIVGLFSSPGALGAFGSAGFCSCPAGVAELAAPEAGAAEAGAGEGGTGEVEGVDCAVAPTANRSRTRPQLASNFVPEVSI
jgi:hypothetical protein